VGDTEWVPLAREFYDRDPATVARELLGKRLLRRTGGAICGGRIVEAEAYLAQRDPACHASRGRNRKNATMFGPPGHAYVYIIHARFCLNAVTQPEGIPSAILIRAIEPVWGIEQMYARRGTERAVDLARGPARLCEALAIDRRLDGVDLTVPGELWIADDPQFSVGSPRIGRSPRIGVTSARRRLLRFYLAGSPFVSGNRLWLRA
jgi:DNA-3-methyladenine glycosylase